MFLTKAKAILDNAKKITPTIPTGLVEYLFSNVLVSKPARNISLCLNGQEKIILSMKMKCCLKNVTFQVLKTLSV